MRTKLVCKIKYVYSLRWGKEITCSKYNIKGFNASYSNVYLFPAIFELVSEYAII